jgi:hypothetical protein
MRAADFFVKNDMSLMFVLFSLSLSCLLFNFGVSIPPLHSASKSPVSFLLVEVFSEALLLFDLLSALFD